MNQDEIDRQRAAELKQVQSAHPDVGFFTQQALADGMVMFILTTFSLFPMVLLRHKIGYRTLKPMLITSMAFMLCLVSCEAAIAMFLMGLSTMSTMRFILPAAITGLAVYHRFAAWRRITEGERWHTKSRGVSYLSKFLPWSEHIVQRYAEPVACLMVGFIISMIHTHFLFFGWFNLPDMGLYLMFCGICLGAMEAIIYDVQLNRMLDQLDGLVESEIVTENDVFFNQEKTGLLPSAAPGIEQMAGIAVGFSPELEKQVARRRAANAARTMAQTA